MAPTEEDPARPKSCAACGSEARPLRRCACTLVAYCSRTCQKDDWRRGHRARCVPRRASRGDCPVCFEPLSRSDPREAVYKECCGTKQCRACQIAQYAKASGPSLRACAFCRAPCAATPSIFRDRLERRAALDDATAHFMLFVCHTRGMCDFGVSRDAGLRHLRAAARLGHPDAQFDYAAALHRGEFVVPGTDVRWRVDRDLAEARRLYETVVAARQATGLPLALLYLGTLRYGEGDVRGAAAAYAEAAAFGIPMALEFYEDLAKEGHVASEDLARVRVLFGLATKQQREDPTRAASTHEIPVEAPARPIVDPPRPAREE